MAKNDSKTEKYVNSSRDIPGRRNNRKDYPKIEEEAHKKREAAETKLAMKLKVKKS